MFGWLKKGFNLQGGSNPNGVLHGASDSLIPPSYFPWDWWQKNMKVEDVDGNTTVEACVATISQTIAMLPVRHVRHLEDGGTEVITNSAAHRVLKNPNPFQTKSEFFVDIVRRMLLTGNGYAAATRNNRFEIDAIYPQYRMSPHVSTDLKEVYYSVSNTDLIDLETMLPSRDVLHLKMHTNYHPLIGCTPLEAAKLSGATGTSIQGHANRFFRNMSRPSGVLITDLTLTPDQTKALRERFNELSKNFNTGGTPILTSGLKYQPITMSAVDSEIIATYNMTRSDIASVYRVPLALIGEMDNATFANTETLMRYWVSSGLGFIVEHLENSLERLFNLNADESIEFDTEFLLQADFKGRMDGLKSAVQGGVMTPNEARLREGLPKVDDGDQVIVQMQMIPLSSSADLAQAAIDNKRGSGDLIQDNINDEVDADTAKYVGGTLTKLKGFV